MLSIVGIIGYYHLELKRMKKFNDLLETKEYAFLKNNDRLGKRIILIGLAGS